VTDIVVSEHNVPSFKLVQLHWVWIYLYTL